MTDPTPNDPTLARWLVSDMTALAELVTTTDARTFLAHDDMLTSAQVLMTALETAFFAVDQERRWRADPKGRGRQQRTMISSARLGRGRVPPPNLGPTGHQACPR